MSARFKPAVIPPRQGSEPAYWFLIRDDRFLVALEEGEEGQQARIPLVEDPSQIGVRPGQSHYLGSLDGHGIYTARVREEDWSRPELAYKSLRSLFVRMDGEMISLAGRAKQIVDWDQTHRFCGKCGRPTQPHPRERAKVCPECGLESYPVIAPAVIVAVRREDRLLLARSPGFPKEMFSVLAGFNEPGESLEETVKREIMEEVGIRVAGIRYFGSQPWPFPHSLMIGFKADYAGGEIEIDGREIVEAGWFRPGEMPQLPGPYSISRELIDDFLAA